MQMTNRPMMTMKQFYTHCNHCPFLHMPPECKRAQYKRETKIHDFCPPPNEMPLMREDIDPAEDLRKAINYLDI